MARKERKIILTDRKDSDGEEEDHNERRGLARFCGDLGWQGSDGASFDKWVRDLGYLFISSTVSISSFHFRLFVCCVCC